jgi:hypothetical protein
MIFVIPYNLCKLISSINKYLPTNPKDISLERVYCTTERGDRG